VLGSNGNAATGFFPAHATAVDDHTSRDGGLFAPGDSFPVARTAGT
jgi:hypothetical protein